MKQMLIVCLAFLASGCATQPAAIIVKSPVYTALDTPTHTLNAPTVQVSNPAADTRVGMASDYRSAGAHRPTSYSGIQRSVPGWSSNRQGPRNAGYYPSLDLQTNPLQRIREYSDSWRDRAFSQRRDRVSMDGRFASDPVQDNTYAQQRTYTPHQSGASVQYIPVMIVSVSQAAEQCDYAASSSLGGHAGAQIPAWQDPRNAMAKQLHPTTFSQGSYRAEVDCRNAGYTVTYIGTHPTLGTQFSGSFTTKRPPQSAYLNLPFSL